MNDWSLHDVLDTSWLFFQTAFFTHRYPLRRLPFYTCRRLEVLCQFRFRRAGISEKEI